MNDVNDKGSGDFEVGDWVVERGSDIVGRIARCGDYDGEWHIALPSGEEVACLDVNLRTIRAMTDSEESSEPFENHHR